MAQRCIADPCRADVLLEGDSSASYSSEMAAPGLGRLPGKVSLWLSVIEQIQVAGGCKCFLMGAATVSAGGIRSCLRRQGRILRSPLLFYGLHRGVEPRVKLLPKQMKKVALFVYPGLRMMVEAP